jgi:toxin ParE1/3/4
VKTYLLSAAAEADMVATHDYYLEQAGADVADRFVMNAEDALTHICRQSGTGSLRYSEGEALAGLRFWPLTGFPYLLFYFERDHAIDVVRLLHQSSDIPRHLEH